MPVKFISSKFNSLKEKIISIFSIHKHIPLRTKKVHFAYGKKEILRNLNLSVRTSQIIAVVGKSGSGKSTFLNLISGVLTSNFDGSISILGHDRLLSKKDIGFVPQEIALIPDLSILENIIFFGSLNGLSKTVALTAGKNLLSILKLNISLTRLPSELSGGQKVRLNILVSLLHNPKMLILDEPFVGLDYYNRKMLWHFLAYQKNRRRTVIITTHLLVEAEHHSDRLVLLNDGKIFAKGKLKDIRNKLKIKYVVEVKLDYINKSQFKSLEKYCKDRNIALMDRFNSYVMFAVHSEGQRNYLFKFIEKLGVGFEELSFREPNLDEVFLKVGNDEIK